VGATVRPDVPDDPPRPLDQPREVGIVHQVNDPLSLEKQREVRKVLRQIEAK
jgi:hypothetical protein